MKLSVSRSSVWNELGDEFDFYRSIRACGFRYVDYDMFSPMRTDDAPFLRDDWLKTASETREKMEKIGVRALIAHAPAGEPANPDMTEKLLWRTQRSIEVCAVLGIKNLVYHPGGLMGMTQKDYLDFNTAYARRLLPTLEKTGVTLLLENVGRWDEPYYCHDASEMADLIDAVDHPLYQACLDTGHLSLADGNQYETIMGLGKHLRGLHVQDNFGSLPVASTTRMWRQDLHLPPLMGHIDFDEVMLALKQIGYTGAFNLEPESPRCGCLLYDDNQKGLPLRHMTLDLALEYYSCVHDIAKHMLDTYGVFEE
ncbi:MAG: sugar phosphate isomerase/epimerase [Clostridia bacterium]|nr:sugar phosphate isomerase/epimerase [Clostridia bacterium]